jgi:hypothetical protein
VRHPSRSLTGSMLIQFQTSEKIRKHYKLCHYKRPKPYHNHTDVTFYLLHNRKVYHNCHHGLGRDHWSTDNFPCRPNFIFHFYLKQLHPEQLKLQQLKFKQLEKLK